MTVGVSISEVFSDWICNFVDVIPQYICENWSFDGGKSIGTLHPKVNLFPNHRGGSLIPSPIRSNPEVEVRATRAMGMDRHQTRRRPLEK